MEDVCAEIVENTDIHLAYLDTDFNFIQVNSAYAKGAGFSKEGLIGENHFRLFPDQENQKIFERVRNSGQPVQFHARPFLYKNDRERGVTYWDWTLKPVLNTSSEVVGLVLSLQEVTGLHKYNRQSRHTALKLLGITAVSIFTAELLIMLMISLLPHFSPVIRAVFDSTLLIILVFPLLYIFYFRPMVYHISERRKAQDALIKSYNLLDISVRERTKELSLANRFLQEEIEKRRETESQLRRVQSGLAENVNQQTEQLSRTNEQLLEEIRERKSAEYRLIEERERLFSVLDEIPASVHLVTRDHSIRFANRYFREQFGDVHSVPCHKVLHGSDVPCSICNAKKVFETQTPGEFEEWHSNGRLYHIYNYPFLDTDGTNLILQLGIDITRQKEAEANLRKSEKKFRGLINSMTDTVFTLDDNQRITDIYGNYLENLGLDAKEYRGKTIPDIFGTERTAQHKEAIRRAYQGENVVYEWDLETGDGKVYFQNSLSPVFDADEKITQIVGVARDITRQKNMEKQLIQTEKLMAVAQMSAMISHEFRNSLTSLRMILELQTESENLKEAEIESLRVALSSVSHMENIVTQLVSFSRPEPVKREPADINQVISESIHFVNIHFKKNRIQLITELAESLPLLNLDKMRLKEVFGHMLLNSIQAVKRNQSYPAKRIVKLSSEKLILKSNIRDQSFSELFGTEHDFQYRGEDSGLYLSKGTECILVRIEDNGTGIDSESMEHIFDPFFTTKKSGTGLGLPLVKRIINDHGGIITILSRLEKGSIFNIYLPL
jgi:PAS domain S-box-containing protein